MKIRKMDGPVNPNQSCIHRCLEGNLTSMSTASDPCSIVALLWYSWPKGSTAGL
jgi:hypothetical protein